MDREFDKAVGKGLFGHAMSPTPAFDFGFFHGIVLEVSFRG
jgi:hypothetical protein